MHRRRTGAQGLAHVAAFAVSVTVIACSSGDDASSGASGGADAATSGEPEDDESGSDTGSATETDAGEETPDAGRGDGATEASSTGTALYTDIVINEVQSQATSGYLASDFIELYNRSASAYTFAAGEWYVSDSSASHVFYVPGGTTITGGGYLVLLPNETALPTSTPLPPAGSLVCEQDGTNSEAFGLGSEDAVSLYFVGAENPSPTTAVDATTWTAHVAARARVPDGDAWSDTDNHVPTPGASTQ